MKDKVDLNKLYAYFGEQCNRIKYGKCTTLRCAVRGGYKGNGESYNPAIATCEEYEVCSILKNLDRSDNVKSK